MAHAVTRSEHARPPVISSAAAMTGAARLRAAGPATSRSVDPAISSAFARAIDLSLARDDFRIIYFVLRRARLELVVEANDKHALARGMQGFQVSAARTFNRAAGRTGNVFLDRYRARALTTREAIAAVVARLPHAARRRISTPESSLFG